MAYARFSPTSDIYLLKTVMFTGTVWTLYVSYNVPEILQHRSGIYNLTSIGDVLQKLLDLQMAGFKIEDSTFERVNREYFESLDNEDSIEEDS